MKRIKVCACGKVFAYEMGRGRDRTRCSKQCTQDASKKRQDESRDSLPKCSTPWCENRANRKGSGLCEACYMRTRRKGTTDYHPPPKYRTDHSGGYVLLREPSHSLADSRGMVYEHRFVFYNEHGTGPFRCHWCGNDVEWATMHVDHLDDCKTNNDVSNLVASCPLCNQKRGRWKMVAKQRANGRQITYNGVTKTPGLWAKDLGLSISTFRRRIECWDINDVMTRPHGTSGPKRQEEKERA